MGTDRLVFVKKKHDDIYYYRITHEVEHIVKHSTEIMQGWVNICNL